MKLKSILIAILFIGTILCDISWRTLTAQELSEINPDAFGSITTEQFRSIPFKAFNGFTAAQIRKIPAEVFHSILPTQLYELKYGACQGFTAEQMALPADRCNNFNPESCFGQIPPASFAGFSSECIEALSFKLVSRITGEQFSYIKPSSLTNIHDALRALNDVSVFPYITPAQMAVFRYCTFIGSYLYLMKDETLAAMTGRCIEGADGSAMRNISLHQFNLFTDDVLLSFNRYLIYNGSPDLWLSVSVEKLALFPPSAWSMLWKIRLFEKLFYKHGHSLVNALSAQQISQVWAHDDGDVEERMYHHFKQLPNALYSWDDVKHELHYANWVKILLIDEEHDDFAKHFTFDVLNQMAGLNQMGIRGIVFGKIAPASFANFSQSGVNYLTTYQITNMTADQWNAIPLQNIRLPWDNPMMVPVEVIPNLAPKTLAAMTASSFFSPPWHCDQLLALTGEQKAAFNSNQNDSYFAAMERNKCSQIVPHSSPHSSPVAVPHITTPVTGAGLTGDTDVGAVFAIILGIVAGIQGIAIGYYFSRKRNIKVTVYQPLDGVEEDI